MRPEFYIAYGSNMNVSQMAQRCPTAKVVGHMLLKGHQLMFYGGEHNAVATIEPCSDGKVPVTVWNITPEDEASLDRYEGYPHLYRKEYMIISVDGKSAYAMVYIMNTENCSYGYPSQSYYDTILAGYESAGFHPMLLHKALERTVMKKIF